MRAKTRLLVCAAGLGAATLGGCSLHKPNAEPAQPAAPETQATAGDPVGAGGTVAYGNVPKSLVGTWLMIQSIKLPDTYINGWQVLRIERRSAWDVARLTADRPPIQSALNNANQAKVLYSPDAAAIKSMVDFIPSLRVIQDPERPTKVNLRTPEYFAKAGVPRPALATAPLKLELLSKEPGTALSGIEFYATSVTNDALSGDWFMATLASAPRAGMVPISASGTFTMHRLK
jgi:hypothetical protein